MQKNVSFIAVFLLVVSTLFANFSFADAPQINSIELKIYSATWCGPCTKLHAFLDKHGMHDKIPLTWQEQKLSVKVSNIDVTDREDEAPSLGKVTESLPELQLWVNGNRIYANGGIDFALLSMDAFPDYLASILDKEFLKMAAPVVTKKTFSDVLSSKNFSDRAAFLISAASEPSELHPLDILSHSSWQESLLNTGYSKKSILNFSGSGGGYDAIAFRSNGDLVNVNCGDKGVDGAFSNENFGTAISELQKQKPAHLLVAVNGTTFKDGLELWGNDGYVPWQYFVKVFTESLPSDSKTVFVFDSEPRAKVLWATPCAYFSRHLSTGSIYQSVTLENINNGLSYPDYVSRFLAAGDEKSADLDADGVVSSEESHWYAVEQMQSPAIGSAPMDAVANRYYMQKSLPESISRTELQALSSVANSVEKEILKKILKFSFSKLFLQDKSFSFSQKDLSGECLISPFSELIPGYAKIKWDTLTELWIKSTFKDKIGDVTKLPQVSLELVNDSNAKTPKSIQVNLNDVSGSVIALEEKLTPPSDWMEFYLLYGNKDWKPSYLQLVKRLLFKKALPTESNKDWKNRVKDAESCGF